MSLAPALRRELSTIDSTLPLFRMMSLTGCFRQMAWRLREFGSLLSIFAFIALCMAAVLGAGAALGVPLALAATSLMGRLLFNVSPADVPTFGVITALLIAAGVSGFASLGPIKALRHE